MNYEKFFLLRTKLFLAGTSIITNLNAPFLIVLLNSQYSFQSYEYAWLRFIGCALHVGFFFLPTIQFGYLPFSFFQSSFAATNFSPPNLKSLSIVELLVEGLSGRSQYFFHSLAISRNLYYILFA